MYEEGGASRSRGRGFETWNGHLRADCYSGTLIVFHFHNALVFRNANKRDVYKYFFFYQKSKHRNVYR